MSIQMFCFSLTVWSPRRMALWHGTCRPLVPSSSMSVPALGRDPMPLRPARPCSLCLVERRAGGRSCRDDSHARKCVGSESTAGAVGVILRYERAVMQQCTSPIAPKLLLRVICSLFESFKGVLIQLQAVSAVVWCRNCPSMKSADSRVLLHTRIRTTRRWRF